MGKITKVIIVAALLLLAVTWIQGDNEVKNSSKVTVEEVIDGDTFKVYLEGNLSSIRFLGVDSPELSGGNDPGEFGEIENETCLKLWAEKAKNYTDKLEDRKVTLFYDSEAGRKGYYGRTLAYVEFNGTDFTKNLVRKGYARVYDESSFKREIEYIEAQEEAMRKEKGLWSCK